MNNQDLSGGGVHADDLTWREQDILILLNERLTNREIADQLHLAESTVKDYVGKILSKLYVKNRRQAVERAKAMGLLDELRKTTAQHLTNLPVERTPFVGRRDELLEIKQLLLETRLLTLTGTGGVGKTRLALKTAEGAAEDFEDGCFFVPLAPIRSVHHIIQTIAEAIKFPLATQEDPQHQLLNYLKKRQLLLVMDNFEHLLDGVGIVSEILQTAPEVKVLATSRERLNLHSETNLNVGGMSFSMQGDLEGGRDDDAVTLFMQSARKVRPRFDPRPDERVQITEICQTVGGLPLAIELAAAWIQILNVDEIAEELEKGSDILSTEVRDAPERHRSIRTVFDHSWSMLHADEQEIFKKLSVFRGGFTRDAVQQVSGASLQLLAGLVNKSFINHDPDTGRMEVHELLRQYAQERLEVSPEASTSAQNTHAAYYAEFMQRNWQNLKDHNQLQALTEIEADIENVRAAWRYYLDQAVVPQLWKFIYCLWNVYWIRWWNHAGMELFKDAAKVLQGIDNEEGLALRGLTKALQGYFMAWLDLAEGGYECAKEGLSILQQSNYSVALIFAYNSLSVNAYFLVRYAEEIQAIQEMVKIAAEMDDPWLKTFTMFAESMGALIAEDYQKARQLAEKSLTFYDETGDMIGSTIPLFLLGHAALARGEFQEAKGFYLRSLKRAQKVGFHYSIQTSSKYLGRVAISLGDIAEAEKYLHQSLSITKEIGFLRDIINLFVEFARLRAAQNQKEKAVELLGFVVQHPVSSQTRMLEGCIRDSARGLLKLLQAELTTNVYTAALERGQELELDEILADLVGEKQRN
jgi:predicted ATPase/DNA-binding CsgD family transcriptional regulator